MEYVMDYSKFALEIYQFIQDQIENAKSALRIWLGPEPEDYYLLEDGRVLPTSIFLPFEVANKALYYKTKENHLTNQPYHIAKEGRFKPAVPYLSMTLQQPQSNEPDIDLSEWIGEMRANPVPQSLKLEQLVTLWSMVNHKYVPLSYTLALIDSNGENQTISVLSEKKEN